MYTVLYFLAIAVLFCLVVVLIYRAARDYQWDRGDRWW